MLQEINENFRRAALLLANASRERRYKAVLFSSARAAEGTTTAVLGVARQLRAYYGLNPLVIELNQRRPALMDLFRLDRARSWDAIEDGGLSAKQCVQVTPAGLSVIAAQADAAAIVEGPEAAALLRQLVQEVGDDFDVTLVDTPPILEEACAIGVGAVVPRLILVVEAGRTSYAMLDRVKAELASTSVAIVGTILNKHKRYIPGWFYRWMAS